MKEKLLAEGEQFDPDAGAKIAIIYHPLAMLCMLGTLHTFQAHYSVRQNAEKNQSPCVSRILHGFRHKMKAFY